MDNAYIMMPTPSWVKVLAGILMLIKAQEHKINPSMMNCRRLNSYVTSAISTWNNQSALTASIPRELGLAAQQQSSKAAGTSSFGMSGTNAHLIAVVDLVQNNRGHTLCIWNRAR